MSETDLTRSLYWNLPAKVLHYFETEVVLQCTHLSLPEVTIVRNKLARDWHIKNGRAFLQLCMLQRWFP